MAWQTTARILLIVCCASVGTVNAQPIDVVLALDNSGSMRTNDPQRLMAHAVVAFVAQLPGDSRAGVLIFDGGVRMPLGLTPTTDPAFSRRLTNALDGLDYNGSSTDIPGAVERAIYAIRAQGRPESRRALILFTDGIIDLGQSARDRTRRGWLHSGLTEEAIRQHIGVFGIAFTDSSDYQLIQALSHDTAASYFRIQNASQIVPVFNEIATKLAARPLASPALDSHSPTTANVVRSQVSRATRVIAGAALIATTLAGVGLWALSIRRSTVPVRATLTRVASVPEAFTINRRVIRVGRVAKWRFRPNDLVIDDPRVSKRHAEIRYQRRQFFVSDSSSSNGTFVSGDNGTLNRLKPRQKALIVNGSRVVFHGHEYIFNCANPTTRGERHDETQMASPPLRQQCHVCRQQYDPQLMVKWHRFSVCPSCREEIDQLSTDEAAALVRKVDNQLREARTERL